MAESKLRRGPQDISASCWYYEERAGVYVINETEFGVTVQARIPWRNLVETVRRYERWKAIEATRKRTRKAKRK